eukprot:1160819-Pelagomonas_calceolata.AAC.2
MSLNVSGVELQYIIWGCCKRAVPFNHRERELRSPLAQLCRGQGSKRLGEPLSRNGQTLCARDGPQKPERVFQNN